LIPDLVGIKSLANITKKVGKSWKKFNGKVGFGGEILLNGPNCKIKII